MAKKKKTGKKVRVNFRRNMQNPARKGAVHWTKQVKEEHESVQDTAGQEMLTGKGDLIRKRTVDAHHADNTESLNPDWKLGTVLAVHGHYVKVDDGKQVRNCVIRRILKSIVIDQRNPVAVGDQVCFTPIDADEGVIEKVGDRHGMLYRKYHHKEQLVVTNVDQILIVAAVASPDLRIHLVDRYIIAAKVEGLTPIIVFNKIDLKTKAPLDDYEQLYTSLGYNVVRTSAQTGEGVDELRNIMKDRKSTVAGVSGVGKSSLINAVQNGLALTTKPVNRATGRGVHTTTMAQLLKLDVGGYIVDTPGIRQFALFKIDRSDLAFYFEDFKPFLGKCRYPDCKHLQEPNCAIKEAVEAGEISEWRFDSYTKLYNDQEEFLESWQR